MTCDRSYTSHEQYIFQMCDVESWTELWEQALTTEPMRALIAEGLVSTNVLMAKIVSEQVSSAVNKSEAIRRIATKYHVSRHTVKAYAYRSK